jgi:hypothetical protein
VCTHELSQDTTTALWAIGSLTKEAASATVVAWVDLMTASAIVRRQQAETAGEALPPMVASAAAEKVTTKVRMVVRTTAGAQSASRWVLRCWSLCAFAYMAAEKVTTKVRMVVRTTAGAQSASRWVLRCWSLCAFAYMAAEAVTATRQGQNEEGIVHDSRHSRGIEQWHRAVA